MEESGHYYTVYFTSLAVGFNEQTAYRHAVLAQMPDEVGALDAHDLHMNQCLGKKDVDLDGNKGHIDPRHRFSVEYGIHSLIDEESKDTSSQRQRRLTEKLLNDFDAHSVEFGLMLHRLGDSYAHSVEGNEAEMYKVPSSSGTRLSVCNIWKAGHARHGSDPDYPFLRMQLFYAYLDDLYSILWNKHHQESEGLGLLNKTCLKTLTATQLKNIFERILFEKLGSLDMAVRLELAGISGSGIPNVKYTRQIFIQQIREKCLQHLGVVMKPYAPELQETRTLQEFLFEHRELDELKIDGARMRKAIENIQQKLDQH